MFLQQFWFEIVHRPGKENSNTNALFRNFACLFIGVENKEGEEDNNSDCNFENFDTDYYSAREEIDQILQLYQEEEGRIPFTWEEKGKGREIPFVEKMNEEQFEAFQTYLKSEESEGMASSLGWGETEDYRENLWENNLNEDDTWGPNYPESEEESSEEEPIQFSANLTPRMTGMANPHARMIGYQYTLKELEQLYIQNIRI